MTSTRSKARITMHVLFSRSRGLGAALAVLALSAGVVFAAAGPVHLNLGLTGSHGPDASAEASEAPESEAPDSEAPDASGAPTDTHGALVSAAAQMPTPPGFPNHGAFVSCVAHMKGVTLATINWSTVTPAACESAEPGNGGNH